MKRVFTALTCAALAVAFTSCGGQNKKKAENTEEKTTGTVTEVTSSVPEYTVVENPTVNLDDFKKDKDGYYVIFDGTFKGWRGYDKDHVPTKWTIDNGAIKFNGSGGGEAQDGDGGDIIFTHKFKNFELELEYKISKGGNSGIFVLAQEIAGQPIYISSPEYQILDNENHPDGKLGVDGNRMSASLYDMIPAVPQNAKPAGEWNKAKIMVYKGTVVFGQNDANVVEFHLWTKQWTELLQKSKFSEKAWPLAFHLLNDMGGPKREGYIGFQDHGDDVWFRNIRVKVLD